MTSHTEQMGTCHRQHHLHLGEHAKREACYDWKPLAQPVDMGTCPTCGRGCLDKWHDGWTPAASKVEQPPNEEAKLHEEAARKIRDTFDLKPTTQDIAEFLQSFYGPRLRRENLCTKHGDNCSGYECGGVEQPAWEAHSGEDYSVVMRPNESTETASIQVMSEDREELAEDIAALLNAPAPRFQGELREAVKQLSCELCGHNLGMHAIRDEGCQAVRQYDPCGCDGGERYADVIRAIRNAGDGK